jgi:putative membrane protein
MSAVPYCGAAPLPGDLAVRFNLDPVLIAGLLLAVGWQLRHLKGRSSPGWLPPILGWSIAAIAFISPLCALSVSLFSARVAQHMILILLAAPLVALGMPKASSSRRGTIGLSALVFFLSLWFWHMPYPYRATFANSGIYWCMHFCLFGSAIWLWRELLHHSPARTGEAFFVGALTSMQMGLLGAMLSLADHAFYNWHLSTTWAWGLTPLEDQQLGGTLMWVPGIAIFLWIAIRSVSRLWAALEAVRGT